MARRPHPGPCTFCLKPTTLLTWDHVLPLSWYPSTTPADLEKWKVPACQDCNSSNGKVEHGLLGRLGLCLEPDDLNSLGISHKVLRSLRAEYATSDKDREARERKRQKILGETVTLPSPTTQGLLPNFGAIPGIQYDEYHAITISEDMLTRYASKLVRGMSSVLDGVLLPLETHIGLYLLDPAKSKEVLALFEQRGEQYHRGPGIQVTRLVASDAPASIYHFEIWRRLQFFVSVGPPTAPTPGSAA